MYFFVIFRKINSIQFFYLVIFFPFLIQNIIFIHAILIKYKKFKNRELKIEKHFFPVLYCG